jgi:drug/metabolite transporter (DMT)-like permease
MIDLRVGLGLLLTLAFSMGGQALLRLGVTRTLTALGVSANEMFRRHLLDLLLSPLIVGGCMLSAVGVLCWLYVLAHFDLSRALPLLGGMGYLVLFALGSLWLGERTSWLQLLGICLLVTGMILIGQKAS